MSADATVITAIGAAIVAILTALVGPKTVEAITKLRKQSHDQWKERTRLQLEERRLDHETTDRRAADQRAHEEQANTAAYKALIARMDLEVSELKTRLDKALAESHDCATELARLEALNERLREELVEVRGRVERLEGRK